MDSFTVMRPESTQRSRRVERATGLRPSAPAFLLLLVLVGCEAPRALEGTWVGRAGGNGPSYTLLLQNSGARLSGRGAVSIGTLLGLAPDTTFNLSVQGTYRPPEVNLVLEGPPSLFGRGGTATLVGFVLEEDSCIVGRITSSLYGREPIFLERR